MCQLVCNGFYSYNIQKGLVWDLIPPRQWCDRCILLPRRRYYVFLFLYNVDLIFKNTKRVLIAFHSCVWLWILSLICPPFFCEVCWKCVMLTSREQRWVIFGSAVLSGLTFAVRWFYKQTFCHEWSVTWGYLNTQYNLIISGNFFLISVVSTDID